MAELPRKIEEHNLAIEKYKKQKTLFKDDPNALVEIETNLRGAVGNLKKSTNFGQQQLLVISEAIRYKKDIITHLKFIIKECIAAN